MSSADNPVEPENLIAAAIDAAEDIHDPLDGLAEKTATDPGAPFAPDALARLAALKQDDRAAFEALRAQLKKAGCRVTALDESVAEENGDMGGRGPTQANILMALAHAAELFHTPDGTTTNGRQIHRLLARITDYVETRSGQASRYAEYAQRGRKGYEIEHIWADHPERHVDEFAHPSEFQEYRNRIGGLLLLPKSFNASYGDLPYGEKREHYDSQNLLARSLHEQA
jgi:hypothetical protein